MGAAEITRFLTSLAVGARVAASTQNQALSALLFLYREVLALDLPWRAHGAAGQACVGWGDGRGPSAARRQAPGWPSAQRARRYQVLSTCS